MKVLVTGGRNWRGRAELTRILTQLKPTLVLQGGCPTGADQFAREWCAQTNTPCDTFPADWNKYGKAAGPMRNQLMVNTRPDAVVAMPGGRGTGDCVHRAQRAGLRIITGGEQLSH